VAGGARRGSGHCRLLVMAVVMRVARRVVLLMVAVVLLLLLVAGLGAVKLARRQVVAVALAHLRRTASLHPARRGRSSARREEAHNFCGCGPFSPGGALASWAPATTIARGRDVRCAAL